MEQIDLPQEKIKEFCRKWLITELALFGSAVRDDFQPDSDVDVLATFDPTSRWTLLDHVEMQDELKAILGRDVDLISRRGIEQSQNHIRRREILSTARMVYVGS
jgi:predicted nucleotidyltransferase